MTRSRFAWVLAGLVAGCTGASGGDGGGGGSEDASDGGVDTGATDTGDGSGGDGSAGADTDESDDDDSDGDSGDSDDSDDADSGDTTGDDGDTTGDSGEESSGSTGGGALPFECEDGERVRVEGGGDYETIAEGVEAAPPDGVVLVCPGEYTENVVIERSVTIRGAGSEFVTVEGGSAPIFLSSTSQAVNLRFEGMTLQHGTRGVSVDWPSDANGAPTLEVEDLHITGTNGIGLEARADGYYGTVDALDTTIEGVDGGTSMSGLLVGGATHFERVTATLTDCTLEDNVAAAGGGMFLRGATVTVSGGRVAANTATQGGGASLATSGSPGLPVPATLTIESSDWGAGAANENQDTDVWCGAVSDAAGFLGADTSAVCTSDGAPCCL